MNSNNTNNNNGSTWYVVLTTPRQEDRANEHLLAQGFKAYCPTLEIEKIQRGKRVTVEEPLFPGYIFVESSEGVPTHTIRSTRGARGLLMFGSEIAKVSSMLIAEIKLGLISEKVDEDGQGKPLLKQGDKVEIQEGPFAGLEAIFHEYDGDKRVIVLLNLLHQQQKLKLDNKHIRS